MYILKVNPRNVFIGKSVDNHVVFQSLYIEDITMSDAVIPPVSTNVNILCVSRLKICFLLGEQLVVTLSFGNSFLKTFRGDRLYQIVQCIYLVAI